MIKKLSFKFVLVFLVLVVSIFITSSCYAFTSMVNFSNISSCPITLDTVKDILNKEGLSDFIDSKCFILEYDTSTLNYCKFYFIKGIDNSYYFKKTLSGDTNINQIMLFDSSGDYVKGIDYVIITFNKKVGTDTVYDTTVYNLYDYYSITDLFNIKLTIPNFVKTYCNIYYSDLIIYNLSDTVVLEPEADTSFKYAFDGVKRGKVKLTINNLDSSLKMFGYVGCENTLNVGDALNTSSLSDYLRVFGTLSNNSDLYGYLYDGEELLYYIVNENYKILKIGYISEMAKGDFLYGFNVNNGVDFVFLRDGKVYWDNSLTFKYQLNNSTIYTYNDIVSQGNYSYIETDKTVVNGTYYGYVYDSSDNLLCSAESKFINDLSTSISISVDTSYYENNVGWNKSCYWLQSIFLSGKDSSGNSIDFSNYSVRWSIPTWVNIDSLEVNGQSYSKRSGTLTGFTSSGALSMFNLKIYELLNNHTSSFDITLQVYDDEDNLVLTHVINSDDIVSKKVQSEENNVDKGDYDILDNPNYTGGSSNNLNNFGNIQDWTVDDYTSLMSTDNFVWEFFKAILGNLPWWIEVPLTILIFGVVIITIIRFARGA